MLEIGEEAARYLGRALRLRSGDTVNVFNGEHGEWTATIGKLGKSDATLLVGEHVPTASESTLDIHLVQGISRGDRMDFVVQKATELGAGRISPVLTRHGVVRLDAARAAKRRAHWQSIAEHACEQCGRIRPPLIDAPVPLNDWFGATRERDSTDLVLQADAATRLGAIDAPATGLCLLIGPEGGLSDRELEDAGVAGFKAVSMGPRILRTETAAIAAIAVAQSCWGDLGR